MNDDPKERFARALEEKGDRGAAQRAELKRKWFRDRLLNLGIAEKKRVEGRRSIIMPR